MEKDQKNIPMAILFSPLFTIGAISLAQKASPSFPMIAAFFLTITFFSVLGIIAYSSIGYKRRNPQKPKFMGSKLY